MVNDAKARGNRNRGAELPKKLCIFDLGAGSGSYWIPIIHRLLELDFSLEIELNLVDLHTEFSQSVFEEFRQEPSVKVNRIQSHIFNFLQENSAKNSQIGTNTLVLVTIFDVIEHLPKHDGWALLYSLDAFCSKLKSSRLLLGAPNGFFYQGPSLDNAHNAHLSSWSFTDFRIAGYKILQGYGVTKIKWISELADSNRFLVRVCASLASSSLVRVLPRTSVEFLAEKRRFTKPKTFL
jgi:hypothetical protein